MCPERRAPVLFEEDFEQGGLNRSRWEVTKEGDFTEATVDVVAVDSSKGSNHRLRLRVNTLGTSDPLKFLGIRSKSKVSPDNGLAIRFELDWNNQVNGCYLTASFYLCPKQ